MAKKKSSTRKAVTGKKAKRVKPAARTKNKRKQVPARRPSKSTSHYRSVQRILSEYTKAQDIHLGKDFNATAGKLHRATIASPIKYIAQNVEQLLRLHSPLEQLKKDIAELPIPFPQEFPFYQFSNEMNALFLDESFKIRISFNDNILGPVNIEGNLDEAENEFTSALRPHLRQFYDSSPVAVFKLVDTDNKTFVEYNIDTQQEARAAAEPGGIKTEPESAPGVPSPPAKQVDNAVELKRLELEIERQKTEQLKLQNERAKIVIDLLNAGFTKKEIKDMGF